MGRGLLPQGLSGAQKENEREEGSAVRRASLQVKFGLSYILVIAAVLVFMNTYPLIASENLVVRS